MLGTSRCPNNVKDDDAEYKYCTQFREFLFCSLTKTAALVCSSRPGRAGEQTTALSMAVKTNGQDQATGMRSSALTTTVSTKAAAIEPQKPIDPELHRLKSMPRAAAAVAIPTGRADRLDATSSIASRAITTGRHSSLARITVRQAAAVSMSCRLRQGHGQPVARSAHARASGMDA